MIAQGNTSKRPSGDFAIVRNVGMGTWLVSTHRDRAAADKARAAIDGEDVRVVCISPLVSSSISVDLVEVMGHWSIRPRRQVLI